MDDDNRFVFNLKINLNNVWVSDFWQNWHFVEEFFIIFFFHSFHGNWNSTWIHVEFQSKTEQQEFFQVEISFKLKVRDWGLRRWNFLNGREESFAFVWKFWVEFQQCVVSVRWKKPPLKFQRNFREISLEDSRKFRNTYANTVMLWSCDEWHVIGPFIYDFNLKISFKLKIQVPSLRRESE